MENKCHKNTNWLKNPLRESVFADSYNICEFLFGKECFYEIRFFQ